MKWMDISEIVGGLVLKDKLDPDAVNPLDMHPTYQHIITMKRDRASMPDIVAKDFSAVDACLRAVERVNGSSHDILNWIAILKKTAATARAQVDLEKVLKRMDRGEDISPAEIIAAAEKLERGYAQWIPLSEVEPQSVKFVETGYEPLDKHVGGIPYACVTILAATPGVGKTSLGLTIISSMIRLKQNRKKKAAVISLEMTLGQIHQRYLEMSNLTEDEKKRILLNRIFNVYELTAAVSELAAKEPLCAVMIDFADLLVEGEQSESAMGVIYKNLELLATRTEVPILLICQVNREAYRGGLPRIYHIRYSGLAEATARLILLLYNPMSVMIGFEPDDSPLTVVEGRAYILVGKSNFGYKEGKPGGIMVDWDGERGWGRKSYGYYPVHL